MYSKIIDLPYYPKFTTILLKVRSNSIGLFRPNFSSKIGIYLENEVELKLSMSPLLVENIPLNDYLLSVIKPSSDRAKAFAMHVAAASDITN